VSDEIWAATKRRQADARSVIAGDRLWRTRRHQYLLSGLLHCGECGYGHVSYAADRLACTGARERRVCANRRTIRRVEVERRVLAAIEQRAMGLPNDQEFCDQVMHERAAYNRDARRAPQQRHGTERRLSARSPT
jgi:hypothetical protein